MNCQYCNKTLADLKSLLKHQKQTKYCLEKQKETNLLKEKNNEIESLKNEIESLKNEIESLKILKNETVRQKFDFNEIQDIIKEYCK